MPLVKKIMLEGGVIGLWSIVESVDDLSLMVHRTEAFKSHNHLGHEKRKTEFLAVRALLAELLQEPAEITYKNDGSPSLRGNNLNISISHSRNMVAIILHKNRVGIDVETVDRPVYKIAAKFLSEQELDFINGSGAADRLKLLCWCAKETIFKIAVDKVIDFKKHIIIEPFGRSEEGVFNATYLAPDKTQQFSLNYLFYENNAVVWCVS